MPFLPLKNSHHLTSNKGKIFANPLQKYWSNTGCTHFSHKHARTWSKASKCKIQIYTWWCTRNGSRDDRALNNCKSTCSWKGGKWEVFFSNQLLTQMSERQTWQTCGAIWLSFFPMYRFLWSTYISQVPCLSWVNHWTGFLLGWVNYIKEQNNFDPVPTVNTSPYLRHTCQQAWLHTCDTVFVENFQKEQDISGIRVHPCTNPPTYTAQGAHCEGIPEVGLLTGQCIYGHYVNGVPNVLPWLRFSCNLNRTP